MLKLLNFILRGQQGQHSRICSASRSRPSTAVTASSPSRPASASSQCHGRLPDLVSSRITAAEKSLLSVTGNNIIPPSPTKAPLKNMSMNTVINSDQNLFTRSSERLLQDALAQAGAAVDQKEREAKNLAPPALAQASVPAKEPEAEADKPVLEPVQEGVEDSNKDKERIIENSDTDAVPKKIVSLTEQDPVVLGYLLTHYCFLFTYCLRKAIFLSSLKKISSDFCPIGMPPRSQYLYYQTLRLNNVVL